MPIFAGRKGDLTWGRYDYPVTPSQKNTLDGLWYMMSGLPKAHPMDEGMPQGYFCSQREDTGGVIIGLHQKSVTVHRSGRLTRNRR